MANEIKVTTGMTVTNGELEVSVPTKAVQLDQTTARGGGPGTVDIGTSEETVDFGDIVPGYVYIKNLDSTNFVDFGFSTGVYGIRVAAGKTALFPMNGGTLYALADTATVSCQIIAANS